MLFSGVQQLQKHAVDGLRGLCVLTGQSVAVHAEGVHVLAVPYKVFDLTGGQLLCHADKGVPHLVG